MLYTKVIVNWVNICSMWFYKGMSSTLNHGHCIVQYNAWTPVHVTCSPISVTLKGCRVSISGPIQNLYGPHQVHTIILYKSMGFETLVYIVSYVKDNF